MDCIYITVFTWASKVGRNRVEPELNRSQETAKVGRTRVSEASSTHVRSRVEPSLAHYESELKMAEQGRTWTDDEVTALLSIWSKESIQQQLLGAVRNVVPFRQIAEELERKGFHRDFKQCRDKIKALKKTYKSAIDRL